MQKQARRQMSRNIRNERLQRIQTRFAIPTIVLPSLGLVVVLAQLLAGRAGPMELVLFAMMYVVTMTGVSVGFHRYLAHRGFQAHPALRGALAILGSMAAQGPVINWVSNHRRHHSHSDEVGDPHSPRVTDDGAALRGWRGFWHAHLGWMLGGDLTNAVQFSPDLIRDRLIARINATYLLWVSLTLAIPTAVAAVWTSTWSGAWQGLLWGGLAPIAVSQHATWGIASLAHIFGTRPFDTGPYDQSRNNLLAALPTWGDAWHNNHHAFPSAAICGFEWWQIDPSGWAIRVLARTGFAWDIRGVPSAEARALKRRRSEEDDLPSTPVASSGEPRQ